MRSVRSLFICVTIYTIGSCVIGGVVDAAQKPTTELALSFHPVYGPVDYETPEKSEYDDCQVKVERSAKNSGWIVVGPNGQVLRRFMDTNGDNVVDRWQYYKHGLEVYRDIDSNFNNKPDQARWLNTAGTRWGLDKNEDRRIDEWKILSAEEASREAVGALVDRDEKTLQALLIDDEDIRTLGIAKDVAQKLRGSVASPGEKLRKVLSGSKVITASTQWMRFDSSGPGLIHASEGKAKQDITVYENAMAIVETDGETGLLELGELVRVGDVWKLTQIPRPLEGNSIQVTVGGILMQPTLPPDSPSSTTVGSGGISEETQKLLKELQKLDTSSPTPSSGTAALARYNSKRADILAKLIKVSKSDEERTQWTKQMVDGIAAAVQSGSFDSGLKRLQEIESSVGKTDPKAPMLPYVTYRRLLAEYTVDLQNASSDKRQKVQEWWLKELEQFATRYPDAEDTPEALLQLAIAEEFAGDFDGARKWYSRLVKEHGGSDAAARAQGAIRRLDLEGKQFAFSATALKGGTLSAASYRGKVLLVLFWSTWCKPCTEDLPQIRALYRQYHGRGFEVIGVNLDSDVSAVEPFLKQHRVDWPQVHQPGGLESEPAQSFGIISLPTMFLVDKKGKVISRGVSVSDLKNLVPELLKK